METKLKFITQSIIQSIWGCQHVEWSHLASNGTSGGVLFLWDKRVVGIFDESVGEYSMACSFKNLEDAFLWAIAGVYVPNLDSERRLLWEEIEGLCTWWTVPRCIGWDSNVTRFLS